VFTPKNIDGYTDNLKIEKNVIQKYFEERDNVRVLDGKYKGEKATVMRVDENNQSLPTLQIEGTQREIQVHTSLLKMVDIETAEIIKKALDINGPQTSMEKAEVYTVGDIVLYNDSKVHGYVIESNPYHVRVVNTHGQVQNVQINKINKKYPFDRKDKKSIQDHMGNPLTIDDTIIVSNKNSRFKDQRGIIRSIHNSTLFLWDRKFMHHSNGIYVELARNVTLKGYELI
jgi:transcription antitermination factor NusG